MANNIALHHVKTLKAGEAGYLARRPRGHMEVWHDSKRYLYDLNGAGYSASEARAFVMQAWACWHKDEVQGRYPSYTVEKRP